MSRFHPLQVTEVLHDTRDSVIVTLQPKDKDAFRFVQGQYLTFRRDFDGQEIRRSYSICSGLDDGRLRVGIKRVEGGAFSTWANENLAPGDTLEAMPPAGNFHVPLTPEQGRHYLGFAGGSGITPVLSIIRTVLAREPKSRFTLVYANRQISSIMFREELEDLKNMHLGRLTVLHVLEQDAQEIELFTGRIDADKMAALFTHWIDPASVNLAFICGPEPMMLTIAGALREHGLEEGQIKFELFASNQPGRLQQSAKAKTQAASGKTCALTITLDGTTRNLDLPLDGTSVLDAALGASLDAPFACKAGVCSTCRAKVLEGEAEMAVNHALEDYEVRQGYVLTCQCLPLSDRLVISYDE
ncbi:2Fe-2S iron-sulfur cluster-binding protein [Roseinatronobacter bogoriensis]|uniref:Phenylacetic acid degradation protein n=1 Tax=Roseinatronobacter bogoriensis subsp. barguzinensis TaxID=441209 RepID=A0A2K8K5L5_9RHOB|nr:MULTISPECIES: 2Fe-2S iron-sulfur cluster-binding protein [Rhodobaca]ATX64744.1 phenylacetic acid degradation protein [Rhodobaca barguzinensis]MBB4208524.1 ring-1,2-phenylacetyl-CoA epoxidase subunit PaaE [Rhodobaca bogoriensis DSM 18756]TDW38207.1 ring-1,2-phenylacetyl-CoA epoxidase subunit PaaE [Rhodobaca barguzinensis]TDY69622.1 ring-1,2-phenylacetyl-CoA epoxidase subunit PaaE [Rhodobaca bogoriensis DSM 18756]